MTSNTVYTDNDVKAGVMVEGTQHKLHLRMEKGESESRYCACDSLTTPLSVNNN